MKLKPYKELLKMTGDKLKETLAPIKANKAKKKAELEIAKLDEQVATLESEITEQCSKDDIDFERIIDKLDKLGLVKRRKKQFEDIINDMFETA